LLAIENILKRVAVIGSGFAGLAGAACMAQQGFQVTVFEKNSTIGGRARIFEADGFRFDMGPSWYWMPEVFENFYRLFGHTTGDFYELTRLSPSYRVYFGKDDLVDLPADLDDLFQLVERMETGASKKLTTFLDEASHKYRIGMEDFVFRPGLSIVEFMEVRLAREALRLNLFQSISSYIRKSFKDPKLIQILEFPVLFLGAKPADTPAMYSLMNYADIALGTWYPQGGMFEIIRAMHKICVEQGVQFSLSANVEAINVNEGLVSSVTVNGKEEATDVLLATADYHHVDQQLLQKQYRSYSPSYWDSRKMSPSCLIYYVGLNRRVSHLLHHTLFFDTDFNQHLSEIYDRPHWPSDPLFYVCCPSKTDSTVAPEGMENLFILIPVAVALADEEAVRDRYFDAVMGRMEALTGESIRPHVVYQRSYAHNDYIADYNAFKGNAFGLANTLRQTAILKPRLRSGKLKNLFFAGQLTTPGPGVPPSLISGQVAAKEIMKAYGR
jgi:phytoene desaturase